MKHMKFILGKKLGMTQVFREDGSVVPVTRVQAGPCVVTQIKTKEKDGVNSIQFGYGVQKTFRLNRPEQGHLKGIDHGEKGTSLRHLKEVPVENDMGLNRGDVFTVSTFEAGDRVKVTGTSKGRGFQGVVKRHGFHGSPASHGHKDQLRMPGSIGATGPARVFKGTRMAGHMGDDTVSVLNLEIIEVHPEENELLIKGAIPGARNGLILVLAKDGEIKVESTEKVEEVVEEPKAEKTTEAPVEEKAEESKKEETKSEVTEEAPVESAESAPEADKTEDK